MSKLTNLLSYYQMSRRVGHTTFMLKGMDFDRPAMVLGANAGHAEILADMAAEYSGEEHDKITGTVGKVRFRTIAILDSMEWTRGVKTEDYVPVIVDHFALQELVYEHSEELIKMFKEKK